MSGNGLARRPSHVARRQVLVRGNIMEGKKLENYCDKNGLCVRCARTQTHHIAKKAFGVKVRGEPIAEARNKNGALLVYKGFCLSPTCYSLEEVKEKLGEAKPRRKKRGHRTNLSDSVPTRLTASSSGNTSVTSSASRFEVSANASVTSSASRFAASGNASVTSSASRFAASGNASVTSSASRFAASGNTSVDNLNHDSFNSSAIGNIKSFEDEDSRTAASGSSRGSGIHGSVADRSARTDLSGSGRETAASSYQSYNTQDNESLVSAEDKAHLKTLRKNETARKLAPADFQNAVGPVATARSSDASDNSLSDEDAQVFADLQEFETDLDFYSLLMTLDRCAKRVKVVTLGLQILRKMVAKRHQQKPRDYVFPKDAWVKIIRGAMSENERDDKVQEEALLTLWYLCALSPFYMQDIVGLGGIPDIISRLERKNPSLDVMCCGALDTLSLSEDKGLKWGHPSRGDCIRRLASVAFDRERSGRDLAISALSNLSLQALERDELQSLLDWFNLALPDNKWLEILALSLNEDERTTEEILWLLWGLTSSPADSPNDSPFLAAAGDLLTAVNHAMSKYDGVGLHEAAFGLIANLLVVDTEGGAMSISSSSMPALVDSILDSMQSHKEAESLQLSGLHALSNILCDPNKRQLAVLEPERLAVSILTTMKNWDLNLKIQQYGCYGLACMCALGEDAQKAVSSNGGIQALASCLQNTDPDSQAPDAQGLRDAVFLVLPPLALGGSADSELMSSGLLEISRDSTTASEGMLKMQISLSASAASNSGAKAVRDHVSFVASVLARNPSPELKSTCLEDLHSMSNSSKEAAEAIVTVDGVVMGTILDVLDLFSSSPANQPAACGILCNIYAHLPFEGGLDQLVTSRVGDADYQGKIRTSKEVTAVKKALKKHVNDLSVAKNSCLAVHNFLSGPAAANLRPAEELSSAFSGILKEIISVLTIHEQQVDIIDSALICTRSILAVTDEFELKRWVAQVLARVFDCMQRFPAHSSIHSSCISILEYVMEKQGDEQTFADIGGSNGVKALVRSLLLDNADVRFNAMRIISRLLEEVFTFSGEMIQNPYCMRSILRCMHTNPEDVGIQAEACSILTSVATLNDFYVKDAIADAGMRQIMGALKNHAEDEIVQENACRTIAALGRSIRKEVLAQLRDTLSNELIRTFREHTKNEDIQTAVLEAFFGLCADDEAYVDKFVESDGMGLIMQAMNAHLESQELQTRACALLWLLAPHGENRQLIGSFGGFQAIVNAMLFHVTKTALQKEALTAIKNTATVADNKSHLKRANLEDAMRIVMWANMNAPSVLVICFEAINNIAVEEESRSVTLIEESILTCILTAMNIHTNNKDIQSNACFTLQSYSFNVENLSIMDANIGELTELLTLAATNFPDDCGRRANRLIDKLGNNYGQ